MQSQQRVWGTDLQIKIRGTKSKDVDSNLSEGGTERNIIWKPLGSRRVFFLNKDIENFSKHTYIHTNRKWKKKSATEERTIS